MRPTKFAAFLGVWWLLAGWVHAQSAGPGAAAYREFTSTTGKALRARLLAVEGEKARLRVSDGKELVVPVAALSAEDQAYIAAWDPRERFRSGAGDGGAGLAKRLTAEGFMTVPLALEGKTLSVQAAVNGKSVTLAFDSGRVLTMIDRALAEEAGVDVLEDLDFGEFRGADGSVVKVVAGTTKSFKLGDAEIPAFELGVVDFARVGLEGQGVVGSDVLQYFDGLVDWQGLKVFLKPQN
jgi:hypothetical protein